MIRCPTCGNTSFQIEDKPIQAPDDDEWSMVIDCTKCESRFTMRFDNDEEVQADLGTGSS
jgi:hypothetical protein